MNVSTPSSNSANDEVKRKSINWNHSIEDLLCDEAEKCFGLAWMHANAEKIFRNKNNWIQIPMIVLSTLSGSFQIGAQMLDSRISQAFSLISFSVSLLGMINSHFKYAQRAEAHKVASVQYAQMHRLISIEMSLSRQQRTPPKYLLKMIKDDLKGFMENFPRIPDKVLYEYKKKFMVSDLNVKQITHPDIVSDGKKVIPYEKTLKIFPVIKEEIEEEEEKVTDASESNSAFNTPNSTISIESNEDETVLNSTPSETSIPILEI